MIDGAALKNVEDFTYLGSCLSSSGGLDTEISCQLSKASSAFEQLSTRLWRERGIMQATKTAVYRAVVLPTLLYGCETWTCYRRHLKKWTSSTSAASAGSWAFPWRTESPTRRYFVFLRIPGVEVLIIKAQLRWTGHVLRMEDSRLPNQIFCSELAGSTRRQGGQTKRYKDSLKYSLRACDIPVKGWEHLAADRSAWWLATHNGSQAFEERRLSQLDIKRERDEGHPAAAVACPVCGRICAADFGLQSHQRCH